MITRLSTKGLREIFFLRLPFTLTKSLKAISLRAFLQNWRENLQYCGHISVLSIIIYPVIQSPDEIRLMKGVLRRKKNQFDVAKKLTAGISLCFIASCKYFLLS